MKILIVEDEIKTGEYLSKGLTEAGFVVDHADNGLTGYHLAMTAEYDLVILDIMLPDVNGWDIIRMLRTAGKGMPVLLLTALGTIEHRVKGLELGADDYLVKPFAFAEQGDILYGSMQTDAAECQSFAPCGGQAIGEGDVLDA